MNKRLIGGIATAFVAASTIVAGATMSGAATVGCQDSGAFQGYCGTQTNGLHLAMNVKQNVAKSGQPVIGYALSAAQNEDFIWLQQGNAPAGQKEAIYAPNGVPTSLCLSDPEQSGAATYQLRSCNGSMYQGFTYTDGEWINAKSGCAISSNTDGKSNLLEHADAGTDNDHTTWTFSSAAA
jgi:hypothetical protein